MTELVFWKLMIGAIAAIVGIGLLRQSHKPGARIAGALIVLQSVVFASLGLLGLQELPNQRFLIAAPSLVIGSLIGFALSVAVTKLSRKPNS